VLNMRYIRVAMARIRNDEDHANVLHMHLAMHAVTLLTSVLWWLTWFMIPKSD
jgi:hypothetical protein